MTTTRMPLGFSTRRAIGALALASSTALALSTTSCGESDAAEPSASAATIYFAGDVEGASSKVGVAIDGTRVLFFLCGGPDDPADTAWAAGTIDADGALAVEGGAVAVDAARTGETIEGTVARARGASRFRATRVQGEPTGLWEAREPEGRVGLIVSSPGDDGAAQGVLLTPLRAYQVTPVRPLRPIDGTLRVRIPDLDRTLAMIPAVP